MDITSLPPPDLEIPASLHTVRVRAIDTTTRMVCEAKAFVHPVLPHHERLNFPTMCFLIEHETPAGVEYVLYDCGARKDLSNACPQTRRMIGLHVPAVEVDLGVDEILVQGGFELSQLKSIVWSHWHWDHIGDGSKFPSTADIVVGPGFTENFVPGWPSNPNGVVRASDLEGHRIHEPDFPLTVCGFRAHDYFGDGSFYLIDVPGHAIGHICGLARTTPDSFVFLGGDCCHFAGALRPTSYMPLPSHLPSFQLDPYYPSPCACSAFTQHHPASNNEILASVTTRTQPFYQISSDAATAYIDPKVAQESVELLQLLDANPRIFICLAHDGVLFDILPLFNHDSTKDINDWQSQQYKERSHWGFLNEFPKGNRPGRKPLVLTKPEI